MGRDARTNQILEMRQRQSRAAVRLEQSSALPPVRDRVGNTLEVGDIVQYSPQFPIFFQIVDVKTVLDPQAPPGAMALILAATFPVQKMAGQPNPDLLFAGTTQQIAPETAAPETPPAPVEEPSDPAPRPALVLTDHGD